VAVAQPQAAPQIVEKPEPPKFPYRIIGRFGPDANPLAVIDAGGTILNIRAGDVVDGKFRVAFVGLESVTFVVEGGEQRIAIAP
jgi:hypothetical protein